MERSQRAHPAHTPPIEHRNRSVIVFLTVCTKNRRQILANAAASELLIHWWRRADAWLVGRYVVMPDHVHLFCAPAATSVPLMKWVQYWKNGTTREWPTAIPKPIWQREFWDRQLRVGDSYEEKWNYVRENPKRHGLVQRSDMWTFQGELNSLEWHDP